MKQATWLKAEWLPICAILVVSLMVYASTLRMGFVYDDNPQIKELPLIRDLRNIPQLFTAEIWQILGGESPYYRPLFYASLALDHFFWKDNPFGYHLTNIVLHAAVSILVYLLAKRMTKSRAAAFVAGLLFAVHPVHAEAVAWVSARNELLSAFFMLLSYLTFVLFLEKRKNTVLFASLLTFFMALLSKEMAITLPLLVFLHVWCFTDGDWRKKLLWPSVYCAAVLPYLLIRASVLTVQTWGNHPLSWKINTGVGIVVSYTRLLVFPANLKVFYNIPIQKIFFSAGVLVPLLLLSAIVASVIATKKHDSRLFFCFSWIYVTLLPVSGFVAFLHPALMAERYLYIPSVGFCMAAGILFSKLAPAEGWSRAVRRLLPMAGIGIVAILAVLTLRHANAWENQHAFRVNMVKDAAGTEFAHYYQGTLYMDEGRADDAIGEFSRALVFNPNLFEAHYDLGIIYAGKGLLSEAEKEFQAALASNPKFVKAHNNLGVVYARQGKIREAVSQFDEALRLDPDDEFARLNFTKAMSDLRRQQYQ